MKQRNEIARILVVLGALGWFAIAIFHLSDYTKDTAKLSPLSPGLQAGFRTVFILAGWDWIVIALIAMIAAFSATTLRKILVLFCGIAGLIQAALALTIMGVFLGTELMFPAATLLIVGGLLFRNDGLQLRP
jgi:uncharacterized membrane protein YuzA (DUF378 family)